MDPEGRSLNERYLLGRRLGQGGLGSVYEAEDRELRRRVAIKLLHGELARDADMRRRFRREGTVLQAIDHPNVVKVLDVGEAEGVLYTALELLEGETLDQRIAAGPLALADLRTLARRIADGLEAAHGQGVLHGDLKPENVFLLGAGYDDAKIVDFSASKVYGLDRLTRTGEAAGTPIYMAPELLTGGEIDARIDVYAFGVLLYHCLAAAAPFTEKHPGRLLYQIVLGEKVPLRERIASVPSEVVEVVDRAMAAQREDRFDSARAVVESLG